MKNKAGKKFRFIFKTLPFLLLTTILFWGCIAAIPIAIHYYQGDKHYVATATVRKNADDVWLAVLRLGEKAETERRSHPQKGAGNAMERRDQEQEPKGKGKTMKLTSIGKVVIVVAVLAVLLFGWGTVWSHVKAVQTESAAKISSVASDTHEAARIRVLLRESNEKILDHADKLADAEGHRARTQSEIASLQGEITKQKEILAKAKDLLSGAGGQMIDVNGKQYSRQQVEDDAVARVAHFKALIEKAKLKGQVIGRLDAAIRDGRTNLAKAKTMRQGNADGLKILEIRLQNARVIESVATFAQGLSEDPLGPQTELGKAFRSFEKRVASLERRNDVLSSENRDGLVVDYENTAHVNAIQAIDEVLGRDVDKQAATGRQANVRVAMDELAAVLNDSNPTN